MGEDEENGKREKKEVHSTKLIGCVEEKEYREKIKNKLRKFCKKKGFIEMCESEIIKDFLR